MTRSSRWAGPFLGSLLPVALIAQGPPAAAGPVCRSPDRPPGRVIEGTVLDLLTLRPLGAADVMLTSVSDRGSRILGSMDTGLDGTYVFCGVPSVSDLLVTAVLQRESSRSVAVPDGLSVTMPPLYIRWSRPADITGRVLDGVSGEPLDGVLVELVGRPVRSLTDDEGDFRILGQGAGLYVVRSSRIGYVTRTDSVDVRDNARLDFEIYLFREPVELAPIVVRVRSGLEVERRSAATRLDVLTEAQVDSLLPRVTDMVNLLRAAHFPGLRIEYVGSGTICIDVTRSPGCNSLAVFVNGLRMPDPNEILDIVPASVSRIQFLDPAEASIRFGGPGVANGVLLITLRRGGSMSS